MEIVTREYQKYKYIFGPVPSRRLGISLGVDVMPHKTCSLDCVYCECGSTTRLTVHREEYTPAEEIIEELHCFLKGGPVLDHITFSGAGEPLLHSRIQEIVSFVKRSFPNYKLALLTNGTLLNDPEVRKGIRDIDIVKISIDTVIKKTFNAVNKPHPNLNIEDIIDGLILFKKQFHKQLWVEVFLVPGLNDNQTEMESVKKVLESIRPSRIHVNTLDRPGAEPWVQAVSKETLRKAAQVLGDVALIEQTDTCEVDSNDIGNFHQHLISTLQRRPCTVEDVSKILGTHFSETKKHLEVLIEKGDIRKTELPRGVFYMMRT